MAFFPAFYTLSAVGVCTNDIEICLLLTYSLSKITDNESSFVTDDKQTSAVWRCTDSAIIHKVNKVWYRWEGYFY